MSLAHLTDRDMEERTLMILRAAGRRYGHRTADALYRDQFRAQALALARQGFAKIKHKNTENETVFITAKGFDRSTGAG